MKPSAILIFFVSVFLASSCKDQKNNITESQTPKYLIGYWIPQQIEWGGDDINSKDTGDVFRTASFRTLCFDTTKKFIYFTSTQRHPRDYNDSIIFGGEPLVNVFAGDWQINDTALIVDYKPVEWETTPLDRTEKHEQIKILLDKDTLLLFQNKLYKRTLKYDIISLQTIEGYKKHYIK